jgi:hypothetical protein
MFGFGAGFSTITFENVDFVFNPYHTGVATGNWPYFGVSNSISYFSLKGCRFLSMAGDNDQGFTRIVDISNTKTITGFVFKDNVVSGNGAVDVNSVRDLNGLIVFGNTTGAIIGGEISGNVLADSWLFSGSPSSVINIHADDLSVHDNRLTCSATVSGITGSTIPAIQITTQSAGGNSVYRNEIVGYGSTVLVVGTTTQTRQCAIDNNVVRAGGGSVTLPPRCLEMQNCTGSINGNDIALFGNYMTGIKLKGSTVTMGTVEKNSIVGEAAATQANGILIEDVAAGATISGNNTFTSTTGTGILTAGTCKVLNINANTCLKTGNVPHAITVASGTTVSLVTGNIGVITNGGGATNMVSNNKES